VWQAALVAGLLGLTVWAWRAAPRWGFWGLWFFVTLAPTSSVVPIATEVGAERRMYLPLVAACVLAVQVACAVARRVNASPGGTTASPRAVPLWAAAFPPAVLGAVWAVVVGLLATTTWSRTREYASGLTLAETIVARRPTPVARHILGEQLGLAGRVDDAIAELRRSVEAGNSRARYQLGMALLGRERIDEATRELDAFVGTEGVRQTMRWLEPPVVDVLGARVALAQIHASARRWPEAEAQARRVLAAAPGHAEARQAMATALFGQERWVEAIEHYRAYLARDPRNVPALINLGVALVATDQMGEAVTAFRRAVAADPANANARRLLDMAVRDAAAVGGILPP
jgi:tetratricopeptide (TPR) repeat protein